MDFLLEQYTLGVIICFIFLIVIYSSQQNRDQKCKMIPFLLSVSPTTPTLCLIHPAVKLLLRGETAAELLLSQVCFPSAVQGSSCLSLSRRSRVCRFPQQTHGADLFAHERTFKCKQVTEAEPRLPLPQRLTFAGETNGFRMITWETLPCKPWFHTCNAHRW